MPGSRGGNISVISAVRLSGVVGWYAYDGAVNKERCVGFLESIADLLQPGDVVVLDNVRFHHSDVVLDVISKAGATPLFIAPYHPELNAIEEVFSFVKHQLRKRSPRTIGQLMRAVARAFKSLTQNHLAAFVGHALQWARLYQGS